MRKSLPLKATAYACALLVNISAHGAVQHWIEVGSVGSTFFTSDDGNWAGVAPANDNTDDITFDFDGFLSLNDAAINIEQDISPPLIIGAISVDDTGASPASNSVIIESSNSNPAFSFTGNAPVEIFMQGGTLQIDKVRFETSNGSADIFVNNNSILTIEEIETPDASSENIKIQTQNTTPFTTQIGPIQPSVARTAANAAVFEKAVAGT